jgi:hypothetical protein
MNADEERYFTLWQKHFLRLEVAKLETTLKHYRSADWISDNDYQFLGANLKMIKAFLNTHIHIASHKTKRISWNNKPPYPQKHKKYTNHHNPSQLRLFEIPNPVSITGKIEVDGLKERLDALKPIHEAMPSGPKFPYKIPAGTYWNQIIIKFLNDEQIEIWVKKQKHVTNYKEMKMTGKGSNPEPNEQWLFLKVLAMCNGELTIKDPEAREKYKKQKQALSETLKSYFSIDYDPFYPYQHNPEKSGNSYKIKLTLIPPPEAKVEINDSDSDDTLGIQDFLNEQAPQI